MVNGILKFSATWCGPCKVLAPKAEAAAAKLGVTLKNIDIDENPDEVAKYGIRSVPTMIAFKEGQPVGILVGSKTAQEIEDFFKKTI